MLKNQQDSTRKILTTGLKYRQGVRAGQWQIFVPEKKPVLWIVTVMNPEKVRRHLEKKFQIQEVSWTATMRFSFSVAFLFVD